MRRRGRCRRVQTLDADGFTETVLTPRTVVWFGPGVIHRLINNGDLSIVVVMQNNGLPEAGDTVLTFPEEVLDDPERYADAATLTPGEEAWRTRVRHSRSRDSRCCDSGTRRRALPRSNGSTRPPPGSFAPRSVAGGRPGATARSPRR
jgi:hypothetical protein